MTNYEKLQRMKDFFVKMALESTKDGEKTVWTLRAQRTQNYMSAMTIEESQMTVQ